MADLPPIRFHYIKSNAFRVVHADGVVGGPTPNGNIHMSFFSERSAIPTMIEHSMSTVDGTIAKIGDVTHKEGKDGFVREVEVGVMMDLTMARVLHKWLGDHITKMGRALADVGGDDAGPG